MNSQQIDEIMKEFGLFDEQPNPIQKKEHLSSSVRKSLPDDHKYKFGVGHPVKKQRYDSNEKQSINIKLGAQGYPDTEYQPTLMDNEEQTTYRMDMNLFPELKSDYNNLAQSEYPDTRNPTRLNLKKNSKSFVPSPHTPQLQQTQQNSRNPRIRIHEDMTHGITLESILDPNFKDTQSAYVLTLRIKYQTDPGESLCVVGDNQELGQWKSFNATMKWTEGHIWMLDNIMIQTKPFFSYKYVLMKDNKPHIWEGGQDRIADLRLLPESVDKDSHMMQNINFFQDKNFKAAKEARHVEIHDIWEQFKLRFTVYFPNEAGSRQQMHIIGNVKQLGEDKNAVPMEQRKQQQFQYQPNNSTPWLYSKYGQDLQPYEFLQTISSTNTDFQKLPKEVKYKYFFVNDKMGMKDFEKTERTIQVQKSETYKGMMMSKEGQINCSKVWIVNGIIDKVDGNFIHQKFKVSKISDTGICIGQYPLLDSEFQQLTQAGVKTIVNLMTDEEMSLKDIKMDQIQVQCNKRQMKYIRMPIKDQNEDEYCYELFIQAKEINKLVGNCQNIFFHCSSGVTRSPTLILVYFCLFKKIEQWKILYNAHKYLLNYASDIQPNLKVVQRVIDQNLAFQNNQKNSFSLTIQLPPKGDPSKYSAMSSEIPQPKNTKPTPMAYQPPTPMASYQPTRDHDQRSASAMDQKYFEHKEQEASIQDIMGEHPIFENSRPGSRRSRSQLKLTRAPSRIGSRHSSAPWDDFAQPAMQSDNSDIEKPEAIETVKYQKAPMTKPSSSSRIMEELIIQQQKYELEAEQKIMKLQQKKVEEEERKMLEYSERIKADEEEKKRVEERRIQAEEDRIQAEEDRIQAEEERQRFKEDHIQAEEERQRFEEETRQTQLRIQLEERQRLEEQQKEAETKRQLESEDFMRMIEEKLRKEMEEKLIKQNQDAEVVLKRKEEDAMLQIQQIKEQQEHELLERKKMKEVKKQMKKEERELDIKKQQEERQQLQNNLELQQQEMEKMRKKLEEEELKHKQLEEKSQFNFKLIEEKIAAEKQQAQKEKDELLQRLKEAEQKEKQELVKLRAIQEAMLSGSHMRRLKQELLLKIENEKIKKSAPMLVGYEEGKEKEQVMFHEMEIGDISYMSGHDRNTLHQQNGPRFEHSIERSGVMPEENELNCTAITNKLHDTRTNYDEVEQKVDNHNNSLLQENDFDNESAHTMPAINKKKKQQSGTSVNRHIETVEAEAEIAQRRYVSELARIAKIADSKRIQKLQQVEMDRQQSLARLRKKEELVQELVKKKKEAEEAEAAIRQLDEYDEEQQRQKKEEQQLLIQEALKQARQEQESRDSTNQKKQDEERKKNELEKQAELKKKDGEINQLKQLLEKQLKMQMQIEYQRVAREKKEEEEKSKQNEERKRMEEENKEMERKLELQRLQDQEKQRKAAEEVKRLEKAKEIRMLFDAAMARVAGELIIQHVENQITIEFEDYKQQAEKEQYEKIQTQKQDEERMLEELQKQQEEQNEKRNEMLKKSDQESEKQRILLKRMSSGQRMTSVNRRKPSNSDQRFMDQSEISNFEDPTDHNETIGDILKYSKNDKAINLSPLSMMKPNEGNLQQTNRYSGSSRKQSFKNHEESKQSIKSTVEDLNYENLALYFLYAPPMPFKPQKGNEVEQAINNTLQKANSKLPVVHIFKNLYLVGCNRLNCDSKFGQAFIKIGGGSQKLYDYLLKNELNIQKQLIDLMVKHQMQLNDLLELLKQDKKLAKGVNGQMNPSSPRRQSQSRQDLRSPTRNQKSARKISQNREGDVKVKQTIAPYSRDSGIFKKQGSINNFNSPTRSADKRVSRFASSSMQQKPPRNNY